LYFWWWYILRSQNTVMSWSRHEHGTASEMKVECWVLTAQHWRVRALSSRSVRYMQYGIRTSQPKLKWVFTRNRCYLCWRNKINNDAKDTNVVHTSFVMTTVTPAIDLTLSVFLARRPWWTKSSPYYIHLMLRLISKWSVSKMVKFELYALNMLKPIWTHLQRQQLTFDYLGTWR